MKKYPNDLIQMKGVKPISVLTAYTCPVARGIEEACVPVILVGDTVGMVEMGFESTREVTIEHMEYHIGAVRRGAKNTHVIGDLPYQTDKDPETALNNAKRLISAGADSIKLEGAKIDVIAHLVANKISVVGHTGLLPQTAKNFKKVGNSDAEAKKILAESKAIQDAGAFMVVLEHIPYSLATSISQLLHIPTIGIGAGPGCDGQVLVINDALGLGDYWPPFSKQYAHISRDIIKVAKEFSKEVESMEFPNNIIQLSGACKS
ncbi:3-methyl-2-oxobutanoate hydroxymethyltransferase [Marinomonas gallaica]|uniref:3-methyl-2-oxobutanoate hydroxymethyltransferase n=1 Tax=Marinomonas gallaica TaxID=1806667 RepID=A0A1C3JNE1_9GAMM|nr:3-methyl-2-oxobutanoate hydroxymethyltransferase [Marinomonas gallaica]SBT16609.1 3-methyl-2-oxobutanoate hydroxymethyltransferase [Marinomonas gallaica]SBT20325.1 3-methyl-2-oxobutanoate hydroxymethyltransferase [Marinomonas gallaica]